MTIALFPGQGVQSPGMGSGLPEARPEVFATASDVLGVDVPELCEQGQSGRADLRSTRWAQPAVLVCSVAAYLTARDGGERFVAAAGHSVGEYAALVVADSLGLTDALRLVTIRAEAMEDAANVSPGGMAAVMRIERATLEEICSGTDVGLAADNGPGQHVISGPTEALASVLERCKEAGAKCRRLDIAGAFHSPAMRPAAARLEDALTDVPLRTPDLEVWSSTTAAVVTDPDEIRRVLVDQLTKPVRWRETIEALSAARGVTFCDLGPGKVVGGLTLRIVGGAEVRYAADLLGAATGGDE